jgi:PAS domain S-box-containing protein
LRASEERYRRIVETANEGVWLIDAANKTTFMNLRMAQMLGCEADMGVGRSPFEFLDEAGRATLAAHAERPERTSSRSGTSAPMERVCGPSWERPRCSITGDTTGRWPW